MAFARNPRVSIILNCYNQAEWVEESVASALHQTFRDFELLITDNGSTDNTAEILKQYSADPRVRLFLHRENVPISRRFNEALDASSGEFISFLYSDDWYLPDKLQRQVELLDRLGPEYGVVYGASLVKNELTGEQWRGHSIEASGLIFRELCLHLDEGPPNMIAPMARRSCFTANRFYEDMFAEGEAVFFRIALDHKFHFDPEPLTVVRDHLRNAGKAIKWNAQMFLTCVKRIEERPHLPKDYLSAVHVLQARILTDVGWNLARLNAELPWARDCLRQAFRTRRMQVFDPKLILAMLLTVLPSRVRGWLNRVGNRLRGVRHNSVYVEGY